MKWFFLDDIYKRSIMGFIGCKTLDYRLVFYIQ